MPISVIPVLSMATAASAFGPSDQITRSLPPSTGTCAPVVFPNSGLAMAATISPTFFDLISVFKQIAGFVFLDRHAVAFGAALEVFLGPQLGIEHRVGMDDVATDAFGSEFHRRRRGTAG